MDLLNPGIRDPDGGTLDRETRHGAVIGFCDAREVETRASGLPKYRAEEDGQERWFMPPAAHDRTVLIVDDEPVVRAVVSRVIKGNYPGWRLKEAKDLAAAKQVLANLQPRLVVLDLRMPDGNGMELCRLIQGHPWLSKTHILILTGYPSHRARQSAFALGACEFLSKPFLLAELSGSIGRLLA